MSPKNQSYWQTSVSPFKGKILKSDLKVDTVIVGAGIAGISTAYMLAKKGIKTAVLEAQNIGFGETGRTTAHLSDALDDRYFHLIKLFGKKGARLARESHRGAISAIAEIISDEHIKCDFEELPGYLFIDMNHEKMLRYEKRTLKKELDAARQAGHEVSYTSQSPLPFISPALRFEKQAQFHPLKYMHGVAEAYLRLDGEIYIHSRVTELHLTDGYIVCNEHKVFARNFCFATNTPINTTVAVHAKQAPYNTYVIAGKIPKGTIKRALYWDTKDPYHYVRLHNYDKENDLIIIGGEDRKTGQDKTPEDRFENLYCWANQRFPMVKEFLFKWSGQVMEPVDSLAFIGQTPDQKNSYLATGDSGNGITHGTIAGMIISDQILNIPNKYSKLYSPSRKNARSAAEFAKENANVAGQYLRHLSKGTVPAETMLHANEGAIIKEGMANYAVYRSKNEICRFSSSCPHLRCPVTWNDAEKTFDCTCHGSRFTGEGEVIHGPAISGLKKMQCRKR